MAKLNTQAYNTYIYITMINVYINNLLIYLCWMAKSNLHPFKSQTIPELLAQAYVPNILIIILHNNTTYNLHVKYVFTNNKHLFIPSLSSRLKRPIHIELAYQHTIALLPT